MISSASGENPDEVRTTLPLEFIAISSILSLSLKVSSIVRISAEKLAELSCEWTLRTEVTAFILASEISNHQLFEKTKVLSATDLLTGLYNRNAMNNRITNIVSGKEDVGDDYGVVFADLNGLKEVNDKQGHVAGDNLLKAAAALIRDVYVDSDIFRVGGDEFLVLVTKHTEIEFNAFVDKLKAKCENSDIVKLAVGTCFGDKTLDIRTAMHLADERMYADKEEYYRKHPELKYRGKQE